MPTKSSVLEKVSSSFMKIPISLAKMRKPISLNLIFFKKKSGIIAKFKFHRHYNYGFIRECRFSASGTRLIFPRKKQYYSTERKNRKNLHSLLVMCTCLGKFGVEEREEVYSSMEVLPPVKNGITSCKEEEMEMLEIGSGEFGVSSVDERAERFIQKFYAQMRMQNQEASDTTSLLLAD
ncbi:uncharacterized protein LOC104896448 [Beta vulgaris subsp. vulgaris]|uniref:uncharacterized protein LOC104896448 n=1 Tax=Beta vulgaris subsp. vulgaris TaxID=3555 RepID=UPI00203730A2|nr:uncharacterized protein LOC104896448 [Beta vulgaris subsp. vulgaris]